ncbi:hypothetical protein Tco_1231747 [Tanacetum coccineum]
MPKESKLLNMFDKMALAINALRDRIDVTLLEDRKRRWMSDSQNSLREFYKTDVIPMYVSLSKTLKELKPEFMEEVQEMLNIFESMEQKVEKKSPKENILQNEIDRLLEVSLTKKLACDISWKSRLSKFNDENVLLKTQVDSVVQERENIKLEYQKLFNSIKVTRAQHQQEVNELVENISQKTYAYGDVRYKNQDLLMIISELKEKLKTFEKGKSVNTKFDTSVTSRKLLCVTPLPTNIAVQAKKVSKSEDNTYRSKPVTSHSIPKSEQKQKKNENVITRGMYKIQKQQSHTRDFKTNMHISNSTGVGSSNSVRRPKSKDTKSKNRVLKNTNAKSSSAYVRKTPSSVRIDSNKNETMNLNECQSNASVLKTKTVNAVNDGLNLVCVSYGKDVFLLSHEKCVARYALSKDSRVKRALFTTPKAAKSRSLGVPLKWVAKLSTLPSAFVSCDAGTIRFKNDHFIAITGYGDYVQGNLTICHVYYVEGLRYNLFLVGQFCDGDLEVAFRSNTCYVRNLEGDDLLTGSRKSNL